jgi:hypothetical protein
MRGCKRIAAIVFLSLTASLTTTLAWSQTCQSCATGAVAPIAEGPLPPVEELPAPPPIEVEVAACLGATREISCKPDGSGYLYSFSVTNNTGKPVTAVLVTPPLNSFTISPQGPLPIPGGVLPNGGVR